MMKSRSTTEKGSGTTARAAPLRPTPMQVAMAFASIRDPEAGNYIQQLRIRLKEPSMSRHWRMAFQMVAERHESLRAAFELTAEDGPVVRTTAEVEIPFEEHDLTDKSPGQQIQTLRGYLDEDCRSGFATDQAPLMRVAHFTYGPEDHELVWTSHHALFDGRGRYFVLQEVTEIYDALEAGRKPDLAPPRPYASFLAWMAARDSSSDQAFWTSKLAGMEEQSPIGLGDFDPERGHGDDRHALRDSLGRDLGDRLESFARSSGVTVNTLVQAAWSLVLARQQGRSEVVFGAPRACRHGSIEGAEEMVGVMVNTVPMRVRLDPDQPVLSFLKDLRELWIEMRPFEHAPLTLMRKAAGLRPEQPLFDSLVGFEGYELTDRLRHDDARWSSREATLEARTELPLTLQLYRSPEWDFVLTYDPVRFPGNQAGWMAGRFRAALDRLVTGSEKTIGQLDVITKTEREQILSWGVRSGPYPHDETVHSRFADVARLYPDRDALVCEDQTWTYAELEGRANELADRLSGISGVDAGLVAIVGPRCPEQIMAILAVLKAGGGYLPLDPEYPDERLRLLVEESSTVCLVACGGWEPEGRGIDLPFFEAMRAGPLLSAPPESGADPDSAAYVMFTSGSTGRPKGVEVPHRAIMRLLFDIDYIELSPPKTLIHLSPAAFDASTFEIWGSLLYGGRCVLYPDRVPTPENLGQLIRQYEVDTLWLTCSLFNFLVDEAVETFEPIRQLLTGGEALSRDHVERALKLLPQTRLINCYGPTEATTFATTYQVPSDFRAAQGPVPIGGPISNTSIVVVGSSDQLAPIGCEGEMLIGGPGVALGYRNRPDLTAEKFVAIPEFPGKRFYRTGDRVLWRSDGNLAFVGRVDDQIKIRGFRIELGEIESELRKIDGIRRAAVVLINQPPRGKILAAGIVPSVGLSLDADQARRDLAKQVPDFMVPSIIRVISELPLNPNGKIDRKLLAERIQSPTERSGSARPESRPDLVDDRCCERFVQLLCQVLCRDEIDLARSFIGQGGDSLLALRMAARASREFKRPFPPSLLLDGRSIDDGILAWQRMDRNSPGEDWIEIESVDRFSLWPLGPKQAHYLAMHRRDPSKPVSVLGRAFLVEGDFNRDAWQEAVNQVVQYQETLRTLLVSSGDGTWAQKVLPRVGVEVEWGTLTPERAGDEGILAALQGFIEQGIDAFNGPIMMVRVLDISSDQRVILLKVLHIAVDGALLTDLMSDLASAYNTALEGTGFDRPVPERQFIDFQEWYRRTLDRDRAREDELFWQGYLADLQPIRFPGWPVSLPGFQSSQGRIRYLSIPVTLANQIRAQARENGITPFKIAFATYVGLLKLYSGQDDIAVGTSVNLREDPRFDGAIGDFSNPIKGRFTLPDRFCLKEVLDEVIQELGSVMDHRYFPALRIRELVPRGESLLDDANNGFVFSEMTDILDGFVLAGASVRQIEGKTRLLQALMSTNFLDSGRLMKLRISYAPEVLSEEILDCFETDFLRLVALITRAPETPLKEFRPTWSEAACLTPSAIASTVFAGRDEVDASIVSRVRDLMQSLLQLGTDPGNQSFFELGGDSVSALRLLRRIHSQFGVEIEYLQFTRDSTAVGLARVIARSSLGRAVERFPPIKVSRRRKPIYLTDEQVKNLKKVLAQPVRKGAGIARAFRVKGDFNIQAYERAISLVLARHESLRLRTRLLKNGRALREYLKKVETDLKVEDLRGIPPSEVEERINLIYKEESLTALPFPVGPAYRFRVIRFPENETLLLVTVSHGATDGLGLVRIFDEIGEAYRAYAVGSEPRLPEVGLQAYDLDRWLEKWRTENQPRLEAYWNQAFAEGIPEQNHPFDLDEELDDLCVGRYRYLDLPVETMDAVGALAEKVGITPYFVLLAGFLVLVNRATGNRTPFASIVADARIHPDSEAVIGNFVHSVPVMARLDEDTRLINAVVEIAKKASQSIAHGGMPVPPMLGRDSGEAPPAVSPLNRTVFNQVPNTYDVLDLGDLSVKGLRRRYVWRKNSISFLVFSNEDGSATAQFSYPTEQMSDGKAKSFVDRYRRIVEAIVETPECELAELGDSTEYVASAQREKVLMAFFEEVLGRPVRRNESFFDHGGDSLTALRLIHKVRAVTSIPLSYADLYSHQTPGDLAAFLDGREEERKSDPDEAVPALRRLPRNHSLPATDNQLVYWRVVTESGGKSTGNIVRPLRIRGRFRKNLFRKAVRAVIERHEALRTGLVPDKKGRIRQKIVTRFHLRFKEESNPGLSERRRIALCTRRADQEGREPFDLSKPPLMRVTVCRFERDDHFMMITVNHAVTDGTSLGIIWNDLAVAYRALCEGRDPGLKPTHYQYVDVSSWQRRVLLEGREEELRQFWNENLVGMRRSISFPLDGKVGKKRARPGAILERRFDPDLTDRLRTLCQRHGLSLYSLSLASFKLMLRAFSGGDDITVSSAVDCREHPEALGVVGHFANRILIRSQIDDSVSLIDFLNLVSRNLAGAFDHRHYPSRRALEFVPADEDGRRMPDDYVFNQGPKAGRHLDLGEVEVSPVVRLKARPSSVLGMTWRDKGHEGMSVELFYARALFKPESLDRIFTVWDRILERMAADPMETVGAAIGQALPSRTLAISQIGGDKHLEATSHTGSDQKSVTYGGFGDRCVPDANPSRKAPPLLIIDSDGQSGIPVCTDHRVQVLAPKAAANWRRNNLGEDRFPHSITRAFRLGGSFDLGAYERALDYVVGRHEALRVVHRCRDDGGVERVTLDSWSIETPVVDLTAVEPAAALKQAHVIFDRESIEPLELTQGVPVRSRVIRLSKTDHLAMLTFYHGLVDGIGLSVVFAEISAAYDAFSRQRHPHLAPVRVQALDYASWSGSWLEAHGAHLEAYWRDLFEKGVPELVLPLDSDERPIGTIAGLLQRLYLPIDLMHRVENRAHYHGVSRFRFLFAGASVMFARDPDADVRMIMTIVNARRHPDAESVVGSFIEAVPVMLPDLKGSRVGQAVEAVGARVDEAVAHASPRAMNIGRQVLAGKGRDDNPFSLLYFNQVPDLESDFRLEGLSVEPWLREHIAMRGMLGITIRTQPDGSAFIQLNHPIAVLSKEHGMRLLEGYRDTVIWMLDHPDGLIETTGVGQVTTQPDVSSDPDREAREAEGATLLTVLGIFERVLGRSVMADTTFFEAGGDSLMAATLLHRVNREFEIRLAFTVIEQASTARELAQAIRLHLDKERFGGGGPRATVATVQGDSLVRLPRPVEPTLMPAPKPGVRNRGLAQRYIICRAFSVGTGFDPDLFEEAFRQVVIRHDALRRCYRRGRNGAIWKIVRDDPKLNIDRIDLSHLPPDEMEEQIAEHYASDSRRPLKPFSGVLHRIKVLYCGPDRSVIIFTFCHRYVDGKGVVQILSETSEFYKALATGEEPDLEPITVQDSDLEAWLNRWAETEQPRLESYWRRVFSQDPPPRLFPAPTPGTGWPRRPGRFLNFTIPAEVMADARRFASSVGSTPHYVILAVSHLFFQRWLGVNELMATSVADLRMVPEAEHVIGNFIFNTPMRVRMKETDSVSAVLKHVTSAGREAMDHRCLNLGQLIRRLLDERGIKGTPLGCVYLNQVNDTYGAFDLGAVPVQPILREMVGGTSFGFSHRFQRDGSVGLQVSCPVRFISPEAFEPLLKNWRTILKAITGNPSLQVGQLQKFGQDTKLG